MKSKQLFLTLFMLSSVCFTGKSQTTPEALLNLLPAVPAVNCSADGDETGRFNSSIHEVKAAIQKEVDKIHSNSQADMEKSKAKIMDNAIKQSGLSEEDVKKLQQSDGNEEEARKAAEKAVSEQYNVSLQELEKVGEMSEAEQEKWAQNYAGQIKNQVVKDPKAATQKGNKTKRMFELASEQKMLIEHITERMNRVAKMFKELDLQDSTETRKLEEKMQPLKEQLCSGICSDAEIARSKAAEKKIYALKIQFCQKMSPLQTNALSQYLTTLKSLFPDYRRLTAVQNEISKLQQYGEIVPEDLSCYTAIDEYANALLSAYRYCAGKYYQ